MSVITAQELNLLRTQPHSTKLWLSVYQPTNRLLCRVNDSGIDRGEREITYDGVTSGSYLNVFPDMTMLVGTSLGSDNKGRVRVKSITSSVITVAENDHINWADDDFLTIISFFEINARYPRIIQDPADELDVIFYKDYDIAYTNQNEVLGSFIKMGPHHAGFLDGGVHQVYYSASGTANVKGDALTYAWFFEGATVTGSTSQNPGYINYTTPGHYTTRLIVSNASGGTDTSYRHVSIYDRPENGTNNPILEWSFEDFQGNRESAGYRGRMKIYSEVPDHLIRDGSLIVIFSDTRYGDTVQAIGGNAENRGSIVFVGYIIDGSIEFNYADGSVTFEYGSPSEIMKIAEGFSISVEDKATPTTWFELLEMDVERAIYHYLRWHSTAPLTMDISFVGTDYRIQYFDSDRGSIYDAVNSLIKNALVGATVSDRQGALWFEVEGYTNGITLVNNFTLNRQDWVGDPSIEDQRTEKTSFIEGGGIKWDGTDFTPFLASAPGQAPMYRGKIERLQGLALDSQSQLNALLGDILYRRNNRFPLSTFILSGNYNNFDIAPQEIIKVNLVALDTLRDVNFSTRNFRIESIALAYDSRLENLRQIITLSVLTSGVAGQTIDIPAVPPTEGDPSGGGGSFDIPPFPFITPPPAGGSGGITQIAQFNHSASDSNTNEDGDGNMIISNIEFDQDGYITDGAAKVPIQGGGIYLVIASLQYFRTTGGTEKVVKFFFQMRRWQVGVLQLIHPVASAYSVGKVGVNDSSIPRASVTMHTIVDGNETDEISFSSIGTAVDINWQRTLYVTIMRLNG